MKTKTQLLSLFLLCLTLYSSKAYSVSEPTPFRSTFGKEMHDILKNMKTYTLDLIRQMPDEHFEFRPAEDMYTFREQIEHIVGAVHFQYEYFLKGASKVPPSEIQSIKEELKRMDKDALLAKLSEVFDTVANFYTTVSEKALNESHTLFFLPEKPERSLRVVSMLLRDHITHHRGQMIVYLRLKGIKPVRYTPF